MNSNIIMEMKMMKDDFEIGKGEGDRCFLFHLLTIEFLIFFLVVFIVQPCMLFLSLHSIF